MGSVDATEIESSLNYKIRTKASFLRAVGKVSTDKNISFIQTTHNKFTNMKASFGAAIALGTAAAQGYVQGFDISSYQPNVNFGAAYSSGARFVIIKVRIIQLP